MLLSEIIERERRFKLALRAGLPILAFIGLVLYAVILKNIFIAMTVENSVLLVGIIFVTVYFIFFLIELSAAETLLDQTTRSFNEKAFMSKLLSYKASFVAILNIQNIETIEEQYGIDAKEKLLQYLILTLNNFLKKDKSISPIIGRRYNGEFIIAIKNYSKDAFIDNMRSFIEIYKTVQNIDIDYAFAVVDGHESYEKILLHLKDLLRIQENNDDKQSILSPTADIDQTKNIYEIEIEKIEQTSIDALQHKNLLFTFRPLFRLKTKQIDIYEVFVKLKSNDTEELLPRVYLPILNRLGLSREYDLTIVKHVFKLLKELDENISLAFNLSPFSLRDPLFQKHFFRTLKSSGVLASRVIIQLYERKTHHDLSGYLKTLEALRDEGVRICIDNFGSSNASMDYMRHFKFDMLQFDRDYIANIQDNQSNMILRSMIDMSKENRILTVAKWVDTEKQKYKLEELGVDYIQGFTVHKPLYEDELLAKHYTTGGKI
ncbi:MAG: EAL domain-containing protein [Sulfurovaceae bacterium]|nr:EAL domain-containing protein [Sulfurovaceae bacterium]